MQKPERDNLNKYSLRLIVMQYVNKFKKKNNTSTYTYHNTILLTTKITNFILSEMEVINLHLVITSQQYNMLQNNTKTQT